jgi:hypothetical protein
MDGGEEESKEQELSPDLDEGGSPLQEEQQSMHEMVYVPGEPHQIVNLQISHRQSHRSSLRQSSSGFALKALAVKALNEDL